MRRGERCELFECLGSTEASSGVVAVLYADYLCNSSRGPPGGGEGGGGDVLLRVGGQKKLEGNRQHRLCKIPDWN